MVAVSQRDAARNELEHGMADLETGTQFEVGNPVASSSGPGTPFEKDDGEGSDAAGQQDIAQATEGDAAGLLPLVPVAANWYQSVVHFASSAEDVDAALREKLPWLMLLSCLMVCGQTLTMMGICEIQIDGTNRGPSSSPLLHPH